tara:strand:- start:2329 stop:4356 length:2028 start_codon:yes stop_codon:yes gene_type:complete
MTEIDILNTRSELEKLIHNLTNSYTELQRNHFEENQKLNKEILKLTNNNKQLLDEIEEKIKDNIDLSKKCHEYEQMINSQNEKIEILEQEEDNSKKVSILKKQADEIERLENYVKILESQKEKNIKLNVEEDNPKKRKIEEIQEKVKQEEKSEQIVKEMYESKEEEIIVWKLYLKNSYYLDPEKLVISRQAYADHLNTNLDSVTDEIVANTSIGINGWYEEGIKTKKPKLILEGLDDKDIQKDISEDIIEDVNKMSIDDKPNELINSIKFIKLNEDKFLQLIDNDKSLINTIKDQVQIDSIVDNLEKVYEYLETDESLNNTISDMIKNKENYVSKNFKPDFKLETGELVYTIKTETDDIKVYNIENNKYIGEKIDEYLESDGHAKVKCLPYNSENKENIIVFTDGACINNGKPDAKAGLGVYFGENDKRNVSKRITGKQTNNTAELSGVIEVFTILKDEIKNNNNIKIYTDSSYVIKCCGNYGEKCEKKEWKNKNGYIPNYELVKSIYELFKQNKCVTIEHIKAHTGKQDYLSKGNEGADLLANKSIEDTFTEEDSEETDEKKDEEEEEEEDEEEKEEDEEEEKEEEEKEEEEKEEDDRSMEVEEKKEEKDSSDESDDEDGIDMTKIKSFQYKKVKYFKIKDQVPPFIYENNDGIIGKKIGKIVSVGSKKKVEFF